MDISTREIENKISILDIVGEIDLYNAPDIKETIKKSIDKGNIYIVINLDKVSYIDSSGIGVLISSLTNLKKIGGELKIINVYAPILKVFKMTKLDKFFDICETEEEAVKNFKI